MKVKFVYYHGTRATYMISKETNTVLGKYAGYTPVESKKAPGYYAYPQVVRKCPV